MNIVLLIYGIGITFLFIGYMLWFENKHSKLEFAYQASQVENIGLHRQIASQNVILASAGRGWMRTAGVDPTRTTSVSVPAPETPVPPARKIRQLTRLTAFPDVPTQHIRSI